MKRTSMPTRTTPLARSPMKRGTTPLPKVNRERRQSEFARCYHSRERVLFVKSLGCVYCTALNPFIGLVTCGKSDNAHTAKEGMGRKGHYTTIVPLCRTHHHMYDERQKMFADERVREGIASAAPEVERMWRRYHGEEA